MLHGNSTMTNSWINIRYSLERIFSDFLAKTAPDVPLFKFAPPKEEQDQRALVTDRAVFLQLATGKIDRNQQIFGTVYILKTWDKSKYLPTFAPDIWLMEFAGELQLYLNRGDDTFKQFFPLYNVCSLLPVGSREAMLASGDTSEISANMPTLPPIIENTGIFIANGHSEPQVNMRSNPMIWETALVFEFYNFTVWQDQRGN